MVKKVEVEEQLSMATQFVVFFRSANHSDFRIHHFKHEVDPVNTAADRVRHFPKRFLLDGDGCR